MLFSSCRQTNKVDRCHPLIAVYNHSLKRLKLLKVPGLREVARDEAERMLFHFNDKPIDMDVAEDLSENDLTPDIVAVTLDRARQVNKTGGRHVICDEFIFGAALQEPWQSFHWEWLLCSHEVHLLKGTLSEPPENYTIASPGEQLYTQHAPTCRSNPRTPSQSRAAPLPPC